jgi:hypothetical protein
VVHKHSIFHFISRDVMQIEKSDEKFKLLLSWKKCDSKMKLAITIASGIASVMAA